jgi:hypothetical protein
MRLFSRLAIGGLAILVAFFALLALDLAWRVWVTRAGFPGAADVALLMTLEIVRASVTLAVVGIALAALRRPEPGHAALAAALLFLALWYAKATAFAAFPGFFQQRLALTLLDLGVSRDLLKFVFGQPTWALAPFVASFLAFAGRYPQPPRPDEVRSVHATGRRGMLRGVALAGTDVRSLVHRLGAHALEHGMLHPALLTAGGLLGAVELAFGVPAVRIPLLCVLALGFGMGIAFLRTASLMHDGPHRRRLRFLAAAGASVCVEFVGSAAISFAPGATIASVALVLASTAPLSAVAFLTSFMYRQNTALGPKPA